MVVRFRRVQDCPVLSDRSGTVSRRSHLRHAQRGGVAGEVVREDRDGHWRVLGGLGLVIRHNRVRGDVGNLDHHSGGVFPAVTVAGLDFQFEPPGTSLEVLAGADVGDPAGARVHREPLGVSLDQLVGHRVSFWILGFHLAERHRFRIPADVLREFEEVARRTELRTLVGRASASASASTSATASNGDSNGTGAVVRRVGFPGHRAHAGAI